MRTFGVVFLTALITKYSFFEQVIEDFSAEELVSESVVETLDVAVFPRRTRSVELSLDLKVRQAAPDRVGHEIRVVVVKTADTPESIRPFRAAQTRSEAPDYVSKTTT